MTDTTKMTKMKALVMGKKVSVENIGLVVPSFLKAQILSLEEKTASSGVNATGGIDLDATKINMDVRGQASSAMSSNGSVQGMKFDFENFQGFTFQIIKFNRNQSLESVLYPSQEEEFTRLPH